MTLFREIGHVSKMGLEVPVAARMLRAQQSIYKKLYNSVVVSRCILSRAESR